jgi:hypothetical protein
MDCPRQTAICINPLLKMGRLRVFRYPFRDQFLMDLAQKTQCQGSPRFSRFERFKNRSAKTAFFVKSKGSMH